MTRIAESGRTQKAISVISQLIDNITIVKPINWTIAVMICASDWFSVCDTVSTSLVARERRSPCEWVSKYLNGSRSIFSASALRRL